MREADFFNQPAILGENLGCDLPEYDIQVEDQGRTKSVHVYGIGVPDKLKPFLDWCKQWASTRPADETPLTDPFPPDVPRVLTQAWAELLKLFGGK